MATSIGLGYEAQLVGQVLQQRLIGAAGWTTVDSQVTAAKYRLDGGGTYVRLQYIGDWSYVGGHGPAFGGLNAATGNTTSSASFVANRTGSGNDWNNDAASSPNIPAQTAFDYFLADRSFRLDSNSVQISTDGGVSFSYDLFSRGGPIKDISDAFFVDSSGSRLFYANSASKKFIKIEAAYSSAAFGIVADISGTEYFSARWAASTVIMAGSIAASVQTTPIEVSMINGIITNTTGVALANVTIGPNNATHTQVTIDLGTTTNGKRRQAQGLQLMANNSERNLNPSTTRKGELYIMVFLNPLEVPSVINLILN